ncbi:MAG TPA: hypothetical protein VGA39_02650 [Candidatus Acidoferrales bacterium]
MPQCFHLDSRGRRCGRQAEEGVYFCDEHAPGPGPGQPATDLRKLGFRLVALILLVVFLLPLMVRAYRFLVGMFN